MLVEIVYMLYFELYRVSLVKCHAEGTSYVLCEARNVRSYLKMGYSSKLLVDKMVL